MLKIEVVLLLPQKIQSTLKKGDTQPMMLLYWHMCTVVLQYTSVSGVLRWLNIVLSLYEYNLQVKLLFKTYPVAKSNNVFFKKKLLYNFNWWFHKFFMFQWPLTKKLWLSLWCKIAAKLQDSEIWWPVVTTGKIPAGATNWELYIISHLWGVQLETATNLIKRHCWVTCDRWKYIRAPSATFILMKDEDYC